MANFPNIESTINFLKKIFLEKDYEIHFSGDIYEGRKLKDEICNDLNLDLIIEDSPYYSKNCAEKGIKVLLLDKPWNQNCEHENIIRVNNWKEVLEKIKEMGDGK